MGINTPLLTPPQRHIPRIQLTSQKTLRPQESFTKKSTLLYSAAFACLASFALANPLANTNAGVSRRDTAGVMGALKWMLQKARDGKTADFALLGNVKPEEPNVFYGQGVGKLLRQTYWPCYNDLRR